MHRPLAALAFALLLAAAAPGTTLSSETTADLLVLAERVCCAVVDSVESRRDPRSGFVFTHVRRMKWTAFSNASLQSLILQFPN